MKHRILFVDDDAMVLQGLQRTMRAMRGEWDMRFVNSGASALELMQGTPVDVVVSDMRMPGMNGAELLGEVMKRHPKTVRLILSGHADQGLILKCVGSTHQYLAKPCDPEALRQTVARALNLEASLKNERLQKLIAQMEHLPSVPSLYSQIVDKTQDPEVNLEDIGEIVSQDAGMTAKVLKLVNSAFFGLRREVASASEAVAYLGLDTIKSLVLSLHAFSQFESTHVDGFSISAFWDHSLNTASAAKRIAQIETNDHKLMDEAFVSGLLHDAGKTALAFNFSEQYGQMLREATASGRDLRVAEQESFGANHADVGGYLLGLWGLPTPVVEAIALHHSPSASEGDGFSPLTAVHVANALMNATGDAKPDLNLPYLDRLQLTDRVECWRQDIFHPSNLEPA